ncbi:MAG: hypothetical protein N3G77_07375 [Nitrososphaeria archaeon]|nr:hypothetical protein [Nitrososphaeria archaeon]
MSSDVKEVREVKVAPTAAKIIAVVMIPAIVALNYVGGVIVEVLKLPIWGDTWATMLGTLISGFWVGAVGGFLYNIVMALTVWGLPAWVWGTANVLIAIITWISIKMKWINLKKPITLIPPFIILGFIYPIYCTALSIALFGGGPLWKPIPAAIYSATLAATGNFWLANYVQNVSTEIPDKILSFIVALIIAGRIPEKFKLVKLK